MSVIPVVNLSGGVECELILICIVPEKCVVVKLAFSRDWHAMKSPSPAFHACGPVSWPSFNLFLHSIHIYPFLKLLPSLFLKINNGSKTNLKKLSLSQKSFIFLSFLSLFFRSVFHRLAHFPHPVSLMNRKCKAENTSDLPQIHELAWKPPSGSHLLGPSSGSQLFPLDVSDFSLKR